MASAGKIRYLEWKRRHPEITISHIIIEDDGDKFDTQLDGNVYFEGTYTPDEFTIFGDLYISARRDLQLGKFTIRGEVTFIIDERQRVEFEGFENFFRTLQESLPSNVVVNS